MRHAGILQFCGNAVAPARDFPGPWLSSWALNCGSSPREGQVELRSGYGGMGKALQKGSTVGRRPEHLQGMLQHSPEDLALCSALSEINVILHSFGWPRLLVPARASRGEVISKVQ